MSTTSEASETKVLNEYEAKKLLSHYGIPVTRELLISKKEQIPAAITELGLPIVMKICSSAVSHKTETSMVFVDVRSQTEAENVFDKISAEFTGTDDAVLMQEMIKGKRELMVGMIRDPQFGPCVMFGLGGIFTEVLKDVSFRLAPIHRDDALAMLSDIKSSKILGAIRGMEAVDQDAVADIITALGRIATENDSIREIDVNPLIINGNKPIAVDALIVLN